MTCVFNSRTSLLVILLFFSSTSPVSLLPSELELVSKRVDEELDKLLHRWRDSSAGVTDETRETREALE